jgi:hypothetical protein
MAIDDTSIDETSKVKTLSCLIERAEKEPGVFYDLRAIETKEYSGIYRAYLKLILDDLLEKGIVESCSARVCCSLYPSNIKELYRVNPSKIEELKKSLRKEEPTQRTIADLYDNNEL